MVHNAYKDISIGTDKCKSSETQSYMTINLYQGSFMLYVHVRWDWSGDNNFTDNSINGQLTEWQNLSCKHLCIYEQNK